MSAMEHGIKRMTEKDGIGAKDKKENVKNYKGFVAGVFSGVTKLSGEFWLFYFCPWDVFELEIVPCYFSFPWYSL